MAHRIVRYKMKRKCPFETYNPKRKVELRKENAMPFFVRGCNRFLVLGGMLGFFVSSLLVGMLGFFGIKRRVRDFGANKRIVEYKVKGE